jgi:hypothetical protein
MSDIGPQRQPHSVNQVQAQVKAATNELRLVAIADMTDEQLRYLSPMAGIGAPYRDELVRRYKAGLNSKSRNPQF